MSRVTAQPWKQKTVFGNRPQLWLEVSCGHRTTKTPHKTRQNNTKQINLLLSFSSIQHGTSRFRGLENVNRVTHYKTAKKRLASRLAFVIVQKLLGTKGQTSSWFSQTYENTLIRELMRCNFTAESMRTQHLDHKKTEPYTVFINGGRSERPGFEFTRTRL